MKKATKPFRFKTRVHLRELTGLKAKNLKELLDQIETVPGSVIYHHTHHFLQQHQYLSPEPPNDFAYWVREALGERELGEKLASINTCDFSTIRELRDAIAATIRKFLEKRKGPLREANEGQELYFLKSVSFVFPTPYVAHTLEEFAAILQKITVDAIYFHMFEARLRLEQGTNDFSLWFDQSLGENELARRIARLDPYTHTLDGLRQKMLQLVGNRIKQEASHANA